MMLASAPGSVRRWRAPAVGAAAGHASDGDIPPAEAEERDDAMLDEPTMAA